MNDTVPALSILFMVLAALAGIAIPLVLFLVLRKKYRAHRMPFFIGAVVFVLFAIVLEGFINSLILSSSLGQTIMNQVPDRRGACPC